MYEFLLKKGQLVAFVVGAILVVVHMLMSMGGNYNLGLYAGIALTVVAALAMVVGIAKYFMENPNQLKTLLGFVVLFILLGVLIMMASGDIPTGLQASAADKEVTSGIYKYINGAVNGTLVLLAIGSIGLIVSEVSSLFK